MGLTASPGVYAPTIPSKGLYAPAPAGGLYVPSVGNKGKSAPVSAPGQYRPTITLANGGEYRLLNVCVQDYGAACDGVTEDTTAWQNAIDDVVAFGGGSICFDGTSVVKNPLGQLDVGPITIYGASRTTSILQIAHDLGGTGLFQSLGRHGFDNNAAQGRFVFRDFSVTAVEGHTGDVFNFWQSSLNATWQRMDFANILGSGIIGTVEDSPLITDCTFTNCGNQLEGAPTIYLKLSNEGGFIAGRTNGATISNCTLTGNKDIGIKWWGVQTGPNAITNVTASGSGERCSVFELYDCQNTTISLCTVSGGTDDNIRFLSQGLSVANIVSNCTLTGALGGTPGTGYGVSFYSANADQTHIFCSQTGNTFSGNAAGDHNP